tara:strand:+ start:1405 stop:1554 length:150 start_codon:yes stop_codon:yes gene_type:complete
MEEGLLTKIFNLEGQIDSWIIAEEFLWLLAFWLGLPLIAKIHKYIKGKL